MKPPTGDSRGQLGARAPGDLARRRRAGVGVAFLCVGTQSLPGWDCFLGRLRFRGNYWTTTEVPMSVPFSVTAQRGKAGYGQSFEVRVSDHGGSRLRRDTTH